MIDFAALIELIGQLVDLAGVVVIAGGIIVISLLTVPELARRGRETTYRRYRRRIGKAILLGLELLVAADIIRTVALEPTLEGVAVLGLLVVIRTFLSFSLEVELYGRWPWRRGGDADPGGQPRSG
ncbi:DUF1622 domain-containing protein [soil metagenome]